MATSHCREKIVSPAVDRPDRNRYGADVVSRSTPHPPRPTTTSGRPDGSRSPKIIQIIPYDGIGGVEVAAASVAPGSYPGFSFGKAFIASKTQEPSADGCYDSGRRSENDPLAYLKTLRYLLKRRPSVLVASLWRSCLLAIAVKLLRPRTRLIVFLHNVRDANLVDRLVTRVAARLAFALWADSRSSAERRLGPAFASSTRPVSFLTMRLSVVAPANPAPRFLTWGRLHQRKRIDRAIRLFASIHAQRQDARLTIIGPDAGERPRLEAQVATLGLSGAVDFAGPAKMDAIEERSREHSFFIQTSRFEGMGMAVVEAMQLGLVPVVTPVGEIGAYVTHGDNGIWIADDEEPAIAAVLSLLADPARYRAMQKAAVDTWRDRPLYRDEFLQACADVTRDLPAAKR